MELIWLSYGYLVFAGLFVLLALWSRRYPGVWELAILHKVAVTISAPTLIAGAEGTISIMVADGLGGALPDRVLRVGQGVRGLG